AYSLSDIFAQFKLPFGGDIKGDLVHLKNLHKQLVYKLANLDNLKSLVALEKAIIPIIIEMEREGIVLDKSILQKYEIEIEEKLGFLKSKIYENVGHEFNIKSPKQLSEILFKEKALVAGKKTKSGAFSTNEASLNKLLGVDPIIEYILSFRELEKLQSTYIKTLPSYIDNVDGRVHAVFDQFGAVSGRFSSKNPNMQNIPKGKVAGFDIRKSFVADKGSVFLSFD